MTIEPGIEWKWGALAALAMTVIALYPQINLWITRGSEWQGSYVLTQGDEVAYSAYINALIDGRPRKNDPFNGRDDLPGKPAHESLYSIQFIPAYTIALPARALGLSMVITTSNRPGTSRAEFRARHAKLRGCSKRPGPTKS